MLSLTGPPPPPSPVRAPQELSWDDPRPALLDQTDYDTFVAKRATLRASLKAGALEGVYGALRRGGYGALGTESREGADMEEEGEEDAEDEPENPTRSVWRVKFSAAYGCEYYKNAINGDIVWEDPR